MESDVTEADLIMALDEMLNGLEASMPRYQGDDEYTIAEITARMRKRRKISEQTVRQYAADMVESGAWIAEDNVMARTNGRPTTVYRVRNG